MIRYCNSLSIPVTAESRHKNLRLSSALRSSVRWTARFLLAAAVACAVTVPISAANREAARRVLEGIRQHRDGKFDAAEQAFLEAEKILPDDLRVAFNHACALAGKGDADAARELLQSVVLARDAKLAAAAHYNLGSLAAGDAKTHFGEQPEETPPAKRPEGL